MTTHSIMTREDGDIKIAFDPKDETAVAEAMARFRELTGPDKGMWAAKAGKNGGPSALIREFDPEVDVVFMPQLIGG
jgi:hypothetical protein